MGRSRSGAWCFGFVFTGLAVVGESACSTPHPAMEKVGSNAAALQANNFDGSDLPAKTLALTFDDGPGDYGVGISNYLAGLGIPAAFFDNGNRVKTSTDLDNENNIDVTPNVQTIFSTILGNGHIIGNHTVTHRDMVDEVLPQSDGASQLFKELAETDVDLTGVIPSGWFLFRPPYGSYNNAVYKDLKNTTMNKYVGPINWNMGGLSNNWPNSAADWACWQGQLTDASGNPSGTATPGYATTQECGDLYMQDIAANDHGIILMHDPYSWDQGNTLDMLKYIVPKLIAQGYKFVRVDDDPAIRAALPPCDASCATCSGTSASQCTSCASGSYLRSGSCVACTSCAAGSYAKTACSASSDTVCATCTAGKYSAAGATKCTNCPAGTEAPNAGTATCTACPAGTDTSTSGQTSCNTCAAGTFADAGATSCSSCAPGHFSAADSATCAPCPAGTYAGAAAASCTACADGSYAAPGSAICTTCGSCDDGNACTTDSCNAGTGACEHATISGCSASGDAGAPDASTGAAGDASTDAAAGTSGGDDASAAAVEDSGTSSGAGADGDAAAASEGGGSGASGSTSVDGGANGTTGNGGSSGSGDGGCNYGGEPGSSSFLVFALAGLATRRKRR